MQVGSMFSGIGGLELGLEWVGVGETVWHAELDPHASQVLARHWDVPNLGDVTAVDWSKVEPVDVLCGGFPCQDISYAGLGAGLGGERSGLWWELWRAAGGLRPRWLVVENVAALRNRGLDVVTHSLASIGYVGSWATLRASDVGAPHQRARVFLIAEDTEGDTGRIIDRERLPAADTSLAERRGPEQPRVGASAERAPELGERPGPAAYADGEGLEGGEPAGRLVVPAWGAYGPAIRRWEQWLGRPAPDPVDDRGRLNAPFVEWMMGFPEGWTDQLGRNAALRCLGNAVVPQVAEVVGRQLVTTVPVPA